MTFLDVLPAALTMQPIRVREWTPDLWIRWNYRILTWQFIDGDDFREYRSIPLQLERMWRELPASNGCLDPIEMLKPSWEVYAP